MCISDWRIGRFITHQATAYAIQTSTNLVYPRNSQRVGLMFSARIAAPSVNAEVDVVFESGAIIMVGGGNPTQLYTIMTVGRLVQEAFTMTQTTAAVVGTVTEFFLPEEYMAMAEREFRRSIGLPGY